MKNWCHRAHNPHTIIVMLIETHPPISFCTLCSLSSAIILIPTMLKVHRCFLFLVNYARTKPEIALKALPLLENVSLSWKFIKVVY